MLRQTIIDASAYDDFDNHEKIIYFEDESTDLKAIIGIHNRTLGPSFGGCRIHNYAVFEDAVKDVLRLSKGMSYKSALAGLPLGGGKAVILADPRTGKTQDKMKSFGEAVHALAGDYITAEDVGSTDQDMITISGVTPYVSGLPKKEGAVGGNPSPYTAQGVFYGMRAGLRSVFGTDSFENVHVVVKGIGSVGYDLCRALDKEGAKLTVTDINQALLQKAQDEFQNLSIVDPVSAHEVPCDILAPCALGGSINAQTLPDMKTKLIVGAANNQLQNTEQGQKIHDKGIIYAPDYVVNAGGIIAVAYEYWDHNKSNPFSTPLSEETLANHIAKIEDITACVLQQAKDFNQPTSSVADRYAEEIFASSTPVSACK